MISSASDYDGSSLTMVLPLLSLIRPWMKPLVEEAIGETGIVFGIVGDRGSNLQIVAAVLTLCAADPAARLVGACHDITGAMMTATAPVFPLPWLRRVPWGAADADGRLLCHCRAAGLLRMKCRWCACWYWIVGNGITKTFPRCRHDLADPVFSMAAVSSRWIDRCFLRHCRMRFP